MSEASDFDLHRIVYDDALRAYREVASASTGYTRRSYIRAVFAAIEALTYLLKQTSLRRSAEQPGIYSLGQLAMLREESFSIDHKGAVTTSPKLTPIPANFRFALDMMMQATLPGFKLHVGNSGWESLKRATAVRNRLTHPKSAAEMEVSDHEIRCVTEAFFYVNESTLKALVQAIEVLSAETGQPLTPAMLALKERWQRMASERSSGT